MITVEQALDIVLGNAGDFGTAIVPLEQSIGRVLRETIIADRDFPPYDRVTMDGIAICFERFASGKRRFPVAGIAPAGAPQNKLNNPDACLEVMTGAIMPANFDTVIRYEDVTIQDSIATVGDISPAIRQNIHFKGEDRKANDVLLDPGIVISSAETGVCATVGKASVAVSRTPRAAVISTGDELIPIDQKPEAHQIRRSNVYRLQTVLGSYHVPADTFHLDDDYDEILKALDSILDQYELVILSGGVSMGKFDYLPSALAELGVTKHFHRIRQRPGKPFWYGTFNGKSVFAFPGNPVSSFVCMQQYFVPWLDASLQKKRVAQPYGVLETDVEFTPDLEFFLEVKVSFGPDGKIYAAPVKGNGSGDLANLANADAFIRLPRDRVSFSKGEAYPIIPFRNILA